MLSGSLSISGRISGVLFFELSTSNSLPKAVTLVTVVLSFLLVYFS